MFNAGSTETSAPLRVATFPSGPVGRTVFAPAERNPVALSKEGKMSTLAHSFLPELPSHWSRLCVSRLHYHVTWFTRGKKAVLTADRRQALSEILGELSRRLGVQLEALSVQVDRVHLLLSVQPTASVGTVVRELKGRSALELLDRRPDLRVSLGGHLMWTETYGVSTVSPLGVARRKARLEASQESEHRRSAPASRC